MTDKPENSNNKSEQDSASQDSGEKTEKPGQTTAAGAEQAGGEDNTRSRTKGRASGKPSGSWLTLVLLLVVLAGLGGVGYYQWLHQQRFQNIVEELNQRHQGQVAQVDRLSESVSRVQREVDQSLREAAQEADQRQRQVRLLQQEMEQQLERERSQFGEQLAGLRRQVQAISTTTTEDWKLAEAYYLTRLAGQRLLMERDSGSALALLEAADRIVRGYPDPDLYSVREALSRDITELKLRDSVDREGLYLQIAALAAQIFELPGSEPLNYTPEVKKQEGGSQGDQAAAEDEQSIWDSIRQSFAQALDRLQDVVRVTSHNEPLQPLPSPDQRVYLQMSLQASLDTAQLALMREQPEVYRVSLQKAQDRITRLYADSRERNSVLEELERLKTTEISQQLPDISESQEALGHYLELRHQLAPQTEQPSADQRPSDQNGEAQQ